MRELLARHKSLRMAVAFLINVGGLPLAALVSLIYGVLFGKFVWSPLFHVVHSTSGDPTWSSLLLTALIVFGLGGFLIYSILWVFVQVGVKISAFAFWLTGEEIALMHFPALIMRLLLKGDREKVQNFLRKIHSK